jgi:hypothetical protein
MPRISTLPPIDTITPEVARSMTPTEAYAQLHLFAAAQGCNFTSDHVEAAIKMLTLAVQAEGGPIVVPMEFVEEGKIHDLLEDIVASPGAHRAALIVTGAKAGTRFATQRQDERCLLSTVVVNFSTN